MQLGSTTNFSEELECLKQEPFKEFLQFLIFCEKVGSFTL